jgi:DNA-binding MarR family transcriptional regulator
MGDFFEALCGSRLRARVLTALWSRPTRALGLRALASAAGVDASNAAKILPALVDNGLCERTRETPPRYRASQTNPAFKELATLFARATGPQTERPVDTFAKRYDQYVPAAEARGVKLAQQQHDQAAILSGAVPVEAMYLIPKRLARAAVVRYRDVDFSD